MTPTPVPGRPTSARTLWAVSDLHIAAPGNRELVEELVVPQHPGDWLIVAGDVAEKTNTILGMLSDLNDRFAKVIWVPGNHELFSRPKDTVHAEQKYAELVAGCRAMGVLTPEDPYPKFAGRTIVPMFTLYDHSWRDPRTSVKHALLAAEGNGVMFTDQVAIAPYVDVPLWCQERLGYTVRRLSQTTGPTVLVNHWPLVRDWNSPRLPCGPEPGTPRPGRSASGRRRSSTGTCTSRFSPRWTACPTSRCRWAIPENTTTPSTNAVHGSSGPTRF